jgi:LAO/AO transport system kinase
MVDMVVVTKDDGDNQIIIQKAKHDYERALHILRHEGWIPPVLSCSAFTKNGLPEVLETIEKYFELEKIRIEIKRDKQGLDWMWQLIYEGLKDSFKSLVDVKEAEKKVLSGKLTPPQAAKKLLDEYSKLSSHLPK